jgi:GT2 family glycosyltransferase
MPAGQILCIDVMIPTYGRLEQARCTADAVSIQCDAGDRIFIIWQGTEIRAPGNTTAITYIHSSPPNLPRARNRGIQAGQTPVILFLDDDVIPFDGLVEAHRRAYADASIGAVAGYVDDALFDKSRNAPSWFDETTGSIKQNFSIAQSQDTISFMGANMSVRRDVLLRINGFDDQFKRNAIWEDIDCALRIRAAGHRIWFCADAKVKHLRMDNGCRRDTGLRYLYHRFANTAYFAGKHIPRKYLGSWLTYWKYQLEFLSRKRWLFMRHDPVIVFAGCCGAIGGIFRYLLSKRERFFIS